MEYIDSGLAQHAIGKPTEEEREKLKEDGYVLMSKGRYAHTGEEYEIWLK